MDNFEPIRWRYSHFHHHSYTIFNDPYDFEILVKEHAVKEAEYKKNWFKEYLAAEGAVKQKESWAGYKTSELHYETLVAEALVKAKREKLHSLRTACDALRTLAANVRSQVKF